MPEVPSYLDRFVAIRDKKHHVTRTPLAAAHPLIEKRYEAYAAAFNAGALDGLKGSSKALGLSQILRACYIGSTQPLIELKKKIKDAQPKRLLKYCPMCGTTLPGTFDHYMPAVKFPEFSVHPLNLIPCCAHCNSTKDDDWLSRSGSRQYLHFYADDIPDSLFLEVTLHEHASLSGVGATFSIERPAGLEDDRWALIESHFSRLKLLERYDERGNDEVAEIIASCRSFVEEGGQNVNGFLQRQATDRAGAHGANHWIAVLMQKMAQHPNLMAWVQNA